MPEVPVELEQVVDSALAKNPNNRYQTATEFLTDLQRLKDGVQLNAKLVISERSRSWLVTNHIQKADKQSATRRFNQLILRLQKYRARSTKYAQVGACYQRRNAPSRRWRRLCGLPQSSQRNIEPRRSRKPAYSPIEMDS